MTIAITCSCSARLEVDEKFVGQAITCPDCQKSLEVPQLESQARQTSGLAIASLAVALVGAFTVVGTAVAVVLGVLALVNIRQKPKLLSGRNYALAGIVLGAALTVLSVFAYSSTELFGLDALLRQSQWVGKLRYPDSQVVKRKEAGYQITRPTKQWGIFINQQKHYSLSGVPIHDLLMVNPSKSGYLICMVDEVPVTTSWPECQEKGIKLFRQLEISGSSLKRGSKLQVDLERGAMVRENKEEDGQRTRFMKMNVHKFYQGQKKTYMLWVVKRDVEQQIGNCKFYVVAGGAPASRFESVKNEITEALHSFKILD